MTMKEAKITKPYTPEEIEALLEAVQEGVYPNHDALRDRAFICIMLAAGLRLSEALGLTTDNIDWAENRLAFRDAKSGNERQVAVDDDAGQALREYVGERQGVVFLGEADAPLTQDEARQLVQHIAQTAGVTGAMVGRFRLTMLTRFVEGRTPTN